MIRVYRSSLKDVSAQFERLHPRLKAIYPFERNSLVVQAHESRRKRRGEERHLEMAGKLSFVI